MSGLKDCLSYYFAWLVADLLRSAKQCPTIDQRFAGKAQKVDHPEEQAADVWLWGRESFSAWRRLPTVSAVQLLVPGSCFGPVVLDTLDQLSVLRTGARRPC